MDRFGFTSEEHEMIRDLKGLIEHLISNESKWCYLKPSYPEKCVRQAWKEIQPEGWNHRFVKNVTVVNDGYRKICIEYQ